MSAERIVDPEEDETLLLEIFRNPSLIPINPLHKSYLLELYKARLLLMKTGDRSLIRSFPEIYEETDPDIAKKLKEQVKMIQELTPLTGKQITTPSTLVVYSEEDKR